MKYPWLDAYCLAKNGAQKEYKIEWQAVRYMVGGKMFALEGEDNHKNPIITLKCEPSFGQSLRDQYPDIIPGYYMNKQHWNSVYLRGDVPDDVIRQMIDMSYGLVLDGLTVKARAEIES
ncbi:MAG: MmcQ/YjbR family DNA-binding protein [Eubacteriales bacterium]|nr:MmcQ/YjbR family DNA-binding protein [Eubacteriales bacterium]